MSYCINPNCPKPDDPGNEKKKECVQCGSSLFLQGRYHVKKLLGGGGFGKTFLVDDGGKIKVLKVLLKNHPKAISLFQQEAQVLMSLRHDGIPEVEPDGYFTFFAKGSDEPLHCLVMEYIEGEDLQEWMKKRRHKAITEEEGVAWLKRMVEILDQVHQKNYFHRDIKPHNIMRRLNGSLVLIDFGTAREVSETYLVKVGQGQNVTGIVSPGYTAPEQMNGKAVPQSDFFALGRTFIYLLTGKPPTAFPENPRTGKLQWQKSSLEVSKEFVDIIDYMMALVPGKRPQNAQMILQCLTEMEETREKEADIEASRNKATNTGKKTNTQFNITVNLDQAAKKKAIIIGSSAIALLILAAIASQIYGLRRYHVFPTNPLMLIEGLSSEKLLRSIIKTGSAVRDISLSPNSKNIYSSSDRNINVYQVSDGKQLGWKTKNEHLSAITALGMHPNGNYLVSGSDDTNIIIWDNQLKLLDKLPNAHPGGVNVLAVSPSGSLFASGGNDKRVVLWGFNGKRILTLDHNETVTALAFNADGSILVTGTSNGVIKLWNLNTRVNKQITRLPAVINAIALTPDTQTLAIGDQSGNIKLWNLSNNQGGIVLKPGGSIKTLKFSDANTLLSGGDRITVWNWKTGQAEKTFVGHSQPVQSMVIRGNFLISASLDGTIKIWDFKSK